MIRRDLIHRVLAVRSADPILHHIAPLGLAASAGRCLVVDLDEASPPYSGHTLFDLVVNGIRAVDLEAGAGVAVLSNGGVSFDEAAPTIDRLLGAWGRMVLRSCDDRHTFRVIRVEPHLPEPFTPQEADVVQAISRGQDAGDRIVLPPLRRHQIRSMLGGTIEPRWRWVRSWSTVWSAPWE